MSTKEKYIFIYGKRYDISQFVYQHPGGSNILLEYQYIDATHAFEEAGHSKEAHDMLKQLETEEEEDVEENHDVRERTVCQPDGVPILGNLLSVSMYTPYQSLLEFSHTYSLYPVQLSFGVFKQPMLFFSHPKDVYRILSRDTHVFRKGYSYHSISSVTPQHILILEGDVWRKRRYLSIQLIRLLNKNAISVLYTHAKKLHSHMRQFVTNFSVRIREFSLDVLSTMLFGVLLTTTQRDDLTCVLNEWSYRTTDIFPLWKSSYYPRTIRVKQSLRRMEHMIRCSIEKEQLQDSVLGYLKEEIQQGHIWMEDAIWVVFSVLAMGHENVSSLMTWTMYYLCTYPDIQRECRIEIAERITFPIENSQILDELPLLDMVVKETLRLNPPIPILTREAKDKNVDVNGYEVQSQELVVCPYATQRSKAVWGKDSGAFCPYRWKEKTVGFHNETLTYFPFGYGERRCPGQTFGILETKYLFAVLLRNLNERIETGYTEPEEQLFISLRLNKLHVCIRSCHEK